MSDESKTPSTEDYQISPAVELKWLDPPDLPYRPPKPQSYRPAIGLIGCGGIAATHLDAYRKANINVVAFFDRHDERMARMKSEFFPDAAVCRSIDELLELPDLEIVDATPHPLDRIPMIEKALLAGKHVLSQKPFITDLEKGQSLIDLADTAGLKLAVNQNGRWAGHVSYARHAIEANLIGEISSVDVSVHWDHNWCAGTHFDRIKHLLLYDFAIHWFDMINCYLRGHRAVSVTAGLKRADHQDARPPLLGQAIVDFEHAHASLILRGSTPFGPLDRTVIVGSKGTIVSEGPNLNEQTLTIHTADGLMRPSLETIWFNDGFEGTMSELICAIEEGREPYNSAKDNMRTLEMCFAAIASAETGRHQTVGSIRKLEPNWIN